MHTHAMIKSGRSMAGFAKAALMKSKTEIVKSKATGSNKKLNTL